MSEKYELISFNLCPYVQRAVIMMKRKRRDFDITYIDLKNKPDWFLRLSPLGKVPVLKVAEHVIFESAVICEFIDETVPPPMHPADPIHRARNRAWIEFISVMLSCQFEMTRASAKDSFEEKRRLLSDHLQRFSDHLSEGPFFNGEAFSLVDAAAAPLFMRLSIIEKQYQLSLIPEKPALRSYMDTLLAVSEVKQSVPPEFETLYIAFIDDMSSFMAKWKKRQ